MISRQEMEIEVFDIPNTTGSGGKRIMKLTMLEINFWLTQSMDMNIVTEVSQREMI